MSLGKSSFQEETSVQNGGSLMRMVVNGEESSYPTVVGKRRYSLGIVEDDPTPVPNGHHLEEFLFVDIDFHSAVFSKRSENVMRGLGYTTYDIRNPNGSEPRIVAYKKPWALSGRSR